MRKDNKKNSAIRDVITSPSNLDSEIEDFTVLGEGDVLNKKTITTVIFKSETCIVFLDQRQNSVWMTNSNYGDFAEDFGSVIARVDLLNSTPSDLLTQSQHEAFQRLIGGAIARLLDDQEGDNAVLILEKAETYLKTRTTERARKWFLSSAFAVCGVALLCAALLFVLRGPVQQRIGVTAFEIALASLMGTLGALLSIVLRVTRLDIDAMAGAGVHYFEGAVRTIAGMFGALLVALSVKAGILLGIINSTDKRLPFLLVLGIVAGASERLVPNIIKKVEGTLIVDRFPKK
jgi:hypothetical protein